MDEGYEIVCPRCRSGENLFFRSVNEFGKLRTIERCAVCDEMPADYAAQGWVASGRRMSAVPPELRGICPPDWRELLGKASIASPMSMSMRDRVAARIRGASCTTPTYPFTVWRDGEAEANILEWCRYAADAVLEEMVEPTGAMKDAGADTYGVHGLAIGSLPLSTIDGQPSKAWRAMVEAARKGQ